jgi:hypothetical protein
MRTTSTTSTQPHHKLLRLRSHVSGAVNTLLGIIGDLGVEALLDLLQHLLIGLAADERDGETLGTETTGTADTVEVRVGISG